ncbi:hypothetical protein PLICRDRAFT_54225 [Plicaturopsis crispa FD-325 SS-3]|nr:hypothetical protein PLICRDRAFT_54225 [Plicaturopsis crispa FD-325 SS-3]
MADLRTTFEPLQGNAPILIICTSFVSYVIFKRFEPNTVVPLSILLGLVPATLGLLIRPSFVSLLISVLVASVSYFSLILTYTAVYRLSPLHPLAKYPGPFANKLSKFYMLWFTATSKGKTHIYYQELHKIYGDVVRVGPNELSFRDVEAIDSMMGAPGLPKGPFWEGRAEASKSLVAARSLAEHAHRRKAWTRAFSSTALKDYQEIVALKAGELTTALVSRQAEVVDISKWMGFFAFDFMGEMAFGVDFGLVRQGGDPGSLVEVVEKGVEFENTVAHTPWLAGFSKRLPGPAENTRRLQEFANKSVERRIAAGSTKRDLFYYLTDEEGVERVKPTRAVIMSDGALSVVAGSDTTATTLAALWKYLLIDVDAYKRLQEEIDAAFPDGLEEVNTTKQANMPYLNACINESLRLIPPVLSGSQRSVMRGTGGKVIGSYFVPEETNIFVHFYSIHRDPRYFSHPDTFIPDRWLPVGQRSGKYAGYDLDTHNTAAFVPFSVGPAGCAGKNLALMEVRAVVCFLLNKFDMSIADIDAFKVWEDEMEDYFTVKRGPLPVTVKARH